MKGFSIEERAINLAQYIIDSKDTVRGTAKKFGISKSTVHKDVSERLLEISPSLAKEVRKVLDENKAPLCFLNSAHQKTFRQRSMVEESKA